jgi:8-oxo-dGTP diphosphatase
MKEEKKYLRNVQSSVTCFLYSGDSYLFLKRSDNKRVDPGKLNGIGGRVEPGENFLAAAIREVEEETGYIVGPKDIKLSGVVKLEGGYQEDWIMCFFKINVNSNNIPKGSETEDGSLTWLDKDKVLDSDFELVDDLNYVFKDIVGGQETFFMTAKVGDDEKINQASISKIPR